MNFKSPCDQFPDPNVHIFLFSVPVPPGKRERQQQSQNSSRNQENIEGMRGTKRINRFLVSWCRASHFNDASKINCGLPYYSEKKTSRLRDNGGKRGTGGWRDLCKANIVHNKFASG